MTSTIVSVLSILLMAGGGFISFHELLLRERKMEMRNHISYGRLKRGLIISAGNILLASGILLLVAYNISPEKFSSQWSFADLVLTFGCCIIPLIVTATLGTLYRLSVIEGRLKE